MIQKNGEKISNAKNERRDITIALIDLKEQQQKNYRITELKEKTCNVSETHLWGSIILSTKCSVC